MTSSSDNQGKPLRQQTIILSLVLISTLWLAFLFFRSQGVDPILHNRIQDHLSLVRAEMPAMGREVLAHRYTMKNNYDAISAMESDLWGHQKALMELLQQVGATRDKDIHTAMNELEVFLTKHELIIEDFKSHNALLKLKFLT